MDALRHVYGLIRPGGAMIVLHPMGEERVESAAGVVGVIPDPEFVGVHLPNAETRLAEAVRDGLYVLEAEEHFDVREHFDDSKALVAARQEWLSEQPELGRRIAAAAPPLATVQPLVLRRFALGRLSAE